MAVPVKPHHSPLTAEQRTFLKQERDRLTRQRVRIVNATNAQKNWAKRQALIAKLGVEEVRRLERERHVKRKAQRHAVQEERAA
jgi:hypothetical protein